VSSHSSAISVRSTVFANFPRNLEPAFAHYLTERPELSSQ
jgi:hypothetical protein